MGRAAAVTVALGDQIISMLREHGRVPTSEIRALVAGPVGQVDGDHCPTCTCQVYESIYSPRREAWERASRVYPILERLHRQGAVEKVTYNHSREVFWQLVEAGNALSPAPQEGEE